MFYELRRRLANFIMSFDRCPSGYRKKYRKMWSETFKEITLAFFCVAFLIWLLLL